MHYFKALINDLKKGKVSPVYLFYGEEKYLLERALKKFEEVLLPPGMKDLNMDVVDGKEIGKEILAESIVELAENLPVMSDKRLVVVKEAPFFERSKAGSSGGNQIPSRGIDDLVRYIGNPLQSTCLIITAGEAVDRRSKLYKAVARCGRVVEFKSLNYKELVSWLIRRAGSRGKKMKPDAAAELISRVGKSLNMLENELEKLAAYTGDNESITAWDVRELASRNVDIGIFDVVDAVGKKRYTAALRGIRELLALKSSPQYIIVMIARQFRLILKALELRRSGCPEREAAKRMQVHPFVARKVFAQSRNFTVEKSRTVLQGLLDLDVAIKNGKQDFYPAMETMILKLLAGETNEGPSNKR